MRSELLLSGLIAGLAAVSPAAELEGRALSEGRAVVGATVSALPYETPYAAALREAMGLPEPRPLATATASAEGRFKLKVPDEAPPFVVRVSFGGLAAHAVEGVFEKADAEDLGDISLGRGESVSGRVVDPSGKPVSGARVRIGRDGTPVTTNREGLFRFNDVEARDDRRRGGAPLLSIQADGFEAQAGPVRFSGPVTIRLKPSAALFKGLVKAWNGRPAGDAVVRLVGEAATRWVRADAAGRFEIPGAPPKQGRLQALGEDGASLDVAVPSGASPATFTLGRGATLEGRVTRIEGGKLVPGVKVAASSGGTVRLARTGVDGRYRITGLPQGSYRVLFDEKQFVLLNRRGVELAPGEVKTLDVALTGAVTLVGRVSDEKGQPVSGARGMLGPGSESRLRRLLRGSARERAETPAFVSGADGTFKAARLEPGTNQSLTVSHPDFEARTIPGIDLVAGAARPLSLDVVLSPGFALSGVVKDTEGRPVVDAEVTLNRTLLLQGGGGGAMFAINAVEGVRPRTQTDFEGRFGFRGLPPGDYDVTVSSPGFTRSVSNGVKAGDGATPLEVTLRPGAAIAGRVIQGNGQPVTGYTVSARPSSTEPAAGMRFGPGRDNTSSPLDPDGGFFIDGLTPGTAYDLSLFGAGEIRGEAKKNVVAPTADVEIEVANRGRMVGQVLDAASGTPITDFEASYAPTRSGGMRIVIGGGAGNGEDRTPFSSPEGSFAFEDVPPGNWDVTVWANTYQEARTSGIEVRPGETRVVEVKASRGLVIRGRVVDARGGGGVQDASVSASAGGGGGGGLFGLDFGGREGALTDADGRFEITGRGPGAYQLTARHPLYSEGSARVTLEEKDAEVEIPLTAGGAIAGLVISSQGGPLPGADVSLQGASGGGRLGLDGQSTLTDGAGRFRFDHLAPSRYKVSAALRNETSPVVEVPLNAGEVREDIRLSLDAGASVRGTLAGLPEYSMDGVMVAAQGAQGYRGNYRTNPDGSFEFAGVPPGTLVLRATAGDLVFGSSRTAIKELIVAEGVPEITTEIVFKEGLSLSGTVMRRGIPVGGARVTAFSSGGGRQSSARADENGIFSISGLDAGRTTVIAFAQNFEAQARQDLDLQSDTSIEIVIPTARLSGTVSDAATGLPLEASVELLSSPTAAGSPGGRMRLLTDSSGRFAFDDLEPVDYRITARRSGYDAVTRSVRPTETGEDLRLELDRGSGLAVEARDGQMGFGLRGILVRVQEGATDAFTGQVSLDGEGRGEIPGIPPGRYTVLAQASGYAPIRVGDVMAPSMTLRLSLTPGGAVEFRTTEEFLAGGPRSGQIISLNGAPVGLGSSGPGSFRLSRLHQRVENLAPGRYRLMLDGGVDQEFEISEGGLAVVTLP